MSTTKATATTFKDARVRDALCWVAQEARALKMLGVIPPKGSRLREALSALDSAYAGPDEDYLYEATTP